MKGILSSILTLGRKNAIGTPQTLNFARFAQPLNLFR